MKLSAKSIYNLDDQARKSWEMDSCEVLGTITVDDETYMLFRVKPHAKLSDEDFEFVKTTLKSVGGTYWYSVRVWLVERVALSKAVDSLEEHLSKGQ